jgi:site-specific DNA recombinase
VTPTNQCQRALTPRVGEDCVIGQHLPLDITGFFDELLSDRLNTLKADRDRAKAALERAKEHSTPQIRIDPALIEHFSRTMREKFSTGSVPFRKAYLQALINVIEIDDHHVRIKGSKDLLEKAVLTSQNGRSGCSQMSTRWRARRDSNS